MNDEFFSERKRWLRCGVLHDVPEVLPQFKKPQARVCVRMATQKCSSQAPLYMFRCSRVSTSVCMLVKDVERISGDARRWHACAVCGRRSRAYRLGKRCAGVCLRTELR